MRRLLFIGGKRLGALCLEWLLREGHMVTGVLGRPDENNIDGTVPTLARNASIPCLTPTQCNVDVFSWIRQREPDLGLCAMFPLILPRPLLEAVPGGVFNLHGGMLPDFRGCLGHAWAIILGETATGVTLHRMTEDIDAGPVLAWRKVLVAPDDTGEKLHARLVMSALSLFIEATPHLIAGELTEIPQDSRYARYFGKDDPYNRVIQWAWDAVELDRFLRGMVFPEIPMPHTFVEGQRLQIIEAYPIEFPAAEVLPGTVIDAGSGGIVVCAGRGAVRIHRAILLPHRGEPSELCGVSLADRFPIGTRLGR